MTIKYIFRNLFLKGKHRSLLTMSGIAVGVFSVVLISVIGSSGTAKVSSTLVSMGVDTLLIGTADNAVSVKLTDKELDAAQKLDGVSEAMPLMASTTEARMLGRRLDCYVWGVDKSADSLISLSAIHGRLINNSDTAARSRVCVIDEQFALETYGRSNIVGKKMQLFLGGKYHEFEIIGIATSGLSSLQGMLTNIMPGFMYVPITTMQTLCGRHTYDKLAIKLSDPEAEPTAAKRITEELNAATGIIDGYVCNNLLSQKEQLSEIMQIVTTALSLVAGISLVVSGISVMTTMMMSVNERTREIGIKKAIGAKNRDILAEFLSESVILTLSGSAIGAILALPIAAAGCFIAGAPFTADISSLVICAVSAAAIGAIFGAYPAAKAAKLPPCEALKF